MSDKESPITDPTGLSREMQSSSGTTQVDLLYSFGSFHLDPAERILRRGQETISLTPKAFDTLCVLVENSGRLVTKDQLLDRVWPETFVEEKTLAQNIFILRKTLGTDSEGRNYIHTVAKQGYRFSANVFKFTRTAEEVLSRREHQTEVIIEEEIDSDVPDKFHSAHPVGFKKVRVLTPGIVILSALGVIVLGGLVFGGKLGRNFWGHPPSFSKVQVTKLTNSGNVGPMGLSPDGKYVVYVARGAGQQSLVVRQTGSTSLLEIVPPDKIGYVGASFSPDGNTIYYVTRPYGSSVASLYRIPLLGGTPVKTIEDVDTPVSVSPDGKQIAFIRNLPSNNERQLIIAGATGSDPRVLASTTDDVNFGLYPPAWSPDQKFIAVSSLRPRATANVFGITLVDTRDGSMRPLGQGGWRWVGQLAWLADGDELVLTAAAASDPALSDQIWIVSYPSGEARRITNDVNGHFGIGVSGDRSTIATVVSNRTGAFWVVEAGDLNSARQVTRNSGDRMAQALGISWTPDGRLVYSSQASGTAEIWTMQSDGTQQRQLTFDGEPNTMPVATPDGRYIVYLSNRNGERVIARIDRDGANAKQLAKSGANGLSVTPDSKWIVYTSLHNQRSTLFKLSIDGGEPVVISPATAAFPAVSPDGKFVACYVLTPEQKRRLSIVSFNTGEIVKEFDVYLQYDLATLKWTPDAKAITYVVSKNGFSNIWRQSINGGAPEQLTKWNSDVIFRFDLSRDGRLVMDRGMFTNDIILIRAQDE